MVSKAMIILGIETTCDETGVGIVENGRRILANVVSSSVGFHKKYKGVVPEIAAREQVRVMIPAIEEACQVSSVKCQDVDAIAVAYGPGLIGSLLVGVETAKALAIVWNKPLVPVNHLIGHVYANWLTPIVNSKLKMVNGKKSIYHSPLTINFPLIALIVSGGHTDLILMTDHGKYKWLGGTRDDAAGEAFDKVARILGLGYPGGPEIEKVAGSWSLVAGKKKPVTSNQKPATSYHLPRPMINSKDSDFSFSGLKTAVANLVKDQTHLRGESGVTPREHLEGGEVAAIAHEFQQAIVDVLVTKTVRAAKKINVKSIVVGGGVAANEKLRLEFRVKSLELGIPVFFPSKDLSVDNGAMIAAAAFYNFKPITIEKIQASPGLYFQ